MLQSTSKSQVAPNHERRTFNASEVVFGPHLRRGEAAVDVCVRAGVREGDTERERERESVRCGAHNHGALSAQDLARRAHRKCALTSVARGRAHGLVSEVTQPHIPTAAAAATTTTAAPTPPPHAGRAAMCAESGGTHAAARACGAH